MSASTEKSPSQAAEVRRVIAEARAAGKAPLDVLVLAGPVNRELGQPLDMYAMVNEVFWNGCGAPPALHKRATPTSSASEIYDDGTPTPRAEPSPPHGYSRWCDYHAAWLVAFSQALGGTCDARPLRLPVETTDCTRDEADYRRVGALLADLLRVHGAALTPVLLDLLCPALVVKFRNVMADELAGALMALGVLPDRQGKGEPYGD
jgi:hypothetical protein